ncbi:MAG: porin [Rhodobacter sp.]|nr:porin [Rhodobacter sp.]MCA3514779.1 porin [Rhodobacter sp.]MCA3519252.1 porin [Rhodobacter sp.]MCA3522758.1 porin [Rhodobacter sp.]MCA3525150.1 porin [Rhodobacter sp.]
MKNLLLASTALVLFAGAAAAEVAISGVGRMGMVYDESVDNDGITVVNGVATRNVGDSGFRFSSRIRVLFTLTQETDAGVSFGAAIRADNAKDGNDGKAGSVFLSGAFGKLSMGDVDGAAESAVGNLSGVGYTGIGDLNEAIYLQQENSDLDSPGDKTNLFALPAATYQYTTGPASFYFSLGNPAGVKVVTDIFNEAGVSAVKDIVVDRAIGVGAKYSVDNYSVGFGYESTDVSGIRCAATSAAPNVCDPANTARTKFTKSLDNWIIGGSATFGGFTAKAQYGEGSGAGIDLTQYGISADYTVDAFTVTAFWVSKEQKTPNDPTKDTTQPFGLGVKYDLGGGASIAAGAVDPDIKGEDYRADVGVNFSF